jgi:membrane protein YdbS with pleckstrin-like domain
MIKLHEFYKKMKGSNKIETAENISILFIIVGALVLSIGIGSTSITTKGIPAIISMFGAFLVFVFTIFLILIWLIKEFKE